MNESAYRELFRELGFSSWEKRKLLRHPKGLPSIYFNVGRDGLVYFAVRVAHREAFRGELWVAIEPRQAKDGKPELRTFIPHPGREKVAFESIVGWAP